MNFVTSSKNSNAKISQNSKCENIAKLQMQKYRKTPKLIYIMYMREAGCPI